ncbi:MAG: hypothetical protein MUC36_24185 [Planctomycetes bacterium]|jgi:hypothetical protein|nr:hypothetical protein [Planctomycetota bacterium]
MDEQSRQSVGFDEDDLAALLKSLTPQEPTGDADQMLGAIQYSVVVDVDGERAQADLLERLAKEGYTCRALMS